MKIVARVKLLPDEQSSAGLDATLTRCNEQANIVAKIARERQITRGYDLRKVTYADVRRSGLGSQAAQQVIRKVTDAYTTHRANLKAGNYGPRGSARRTKAEQKTISFRRYSAQPFDDRNLSWDHDRRTVSIWAVNGRLTIPFTGHPDHLAAIAQSRTGESDLHRTRTGVWILTVTLDVPEPVPQAPNGFIGVDLGIVTIAATAAITPTLAVDPDSITDWSGGAITLRRKRNQHLRTKLQTKRTKSATRLLRKRSGKETRFVTNTNHVISKRIVAEAKRTGRGIAVENLTGIRNRVRHRKPQRATFHSWAFAQLGTFLAYKATLAGVPFLQVDPAYTSQTCSTCGHTEKANRPDQATFHCRSCGVSLNADTNAAINIAQRGQHQWQGAVNLPHAA